ncbi:hypothetical protein GCM10010145_09830 [Streptomyces ruber]|uniref:Membrane-bound hydrophilic protein n=2 Tax=Streptomyces TaxID=1883 RepID=A0A918EQJ1_9ACTN|nr:hypothetical protein [Streptomyces ruber]GGQ42850.1 hypothetical protein GCM10010145_09830 [Streptomyces ruber]
MTTDEEALGAPAPDSGTGSGPRHAVFRKPFLARLQVPAGKAMALAAMPTAVLMGMGIAPALARADDKATTSRSLTLEEYQSCVEILEEARDDAESEDGEKKDEEKPEETEEDGEGEEDGQDDQGGRNEKAPVVPSPSVSSSVPAAGGREEQSSPGGSPPDEDSPGDGSPEDTSHEGGEAADGGSSSDSGSDDETGSAPAPAPVPTAPDGSSQSGDRPRIPGLSDLGDALEGLGSALEDVLTPRAGESASPSAPADEDTAEPAEGTADEATGTGEEPGKRAAQDVTGDVAAPVTEPAPEPEADATAPVAEPDGEPAEEPAEEPAGEVTASPSTSTSPGPGSGPSPSPTPSETSTTDPDDCPVATDAEGGLEQDLPALPDAPWYLDAGSLLLKGADYQGIVQVRTANGTVKKVLKYVISDGTDIGDLHQTVRDERTGKLYHVQAGEGTTSTIRDGDTVMYTESISGKLLGLVPVEFSPENPPPLDIPVIYFTDVRVVQAGQFGGTLHIPGLRQYVTD